jgi:hypothetical protein
VAPSDGDVSRATPLGWWSRCDPSPDLAFLRPFEPPPPWPVAPGFPSFSKEGSHSEWEPANNLFPTDIGSLALLPRFPDHSFS